jgi:anaerobic magnesium-protoporphyrin IX monomethyl ester cyclase
MKVLFVYYDVNSSEPARYACGVGAMSAYIKKHGHEVELCYFKTEDDYEVLKEKINRFGPSLIGISATTSGFGTINKLTTFIKRVAPNVISVLGGAHTSITPNAIETLDNIDGVCIGFGERPILTLIEALENNKNYLKTPNFWFRKGSEIIKNPKLSFPDSLNDFCDFDREVFFDELDRLNPDPYNFGRGLLGDKVFEYIFCRACPYSCSFCAAPLIKTWGEGKGWLNFPDPEVAVRKLVEDAEKYNLTGFAFHDDVFTFNRKWFKEWADLYKKECGLPYACNTRVGTFEGPVGGK